jgi:tRNA(Leu) C34 or U34 (ribose-2'-O)-methylase TrmL
MLNIVLVEPARIILEIGRLYVQGPSFILIHPFGFVINDKNLKAEALLGTS